MAVNRLTGLTTGMDTDQLVRDLMKIEQTRYDKIDKQKTYAQWEQEAYRTTIGVIDDFHENYFDILKQDNYLMSPSSFSDYTSKTFVGGESKNYVSVQGSINAKSLTHTIQSVDQLATKDKWNSAETGIAAVNSGAITATTITDLKLDGLSFDLSIDGVTKTIKIVDPELTLIATTDDLVAAINTEIENVFGSGYGSVVTKTTSGSDEFLRFDQAGATIGVYNAADSSSLLKLDIISGRTNETYKTNSLNGMYGLAATDLDDFSINGVKVEGLSIHDTIDEFIDKVNAVDTGTTLSFNALENRFVLEGEKTGGVNNIDFSDSADASALFATLGFADVAGDGSTSAAYRESGKNAILTLDGEVIVKSENIFTIEGVKYTLNEEYTGVGIDPIKITLENNLDKGVAKIKNFVNDYNALIATLHSLTSENKNSDYEPLTKEEKSALSEDQIKDWDNQAKKGILRRESNITRMLDELRTAFYDSVEGTSVTLADLGISTSANYKDKGKLILDEVKLKGALEEDFEGVVMLFTKESDNKYLEKGTTSERYAENGLMQRLDDIISNHIRTSRDNDGNKGYLVERAGLVGDSSVVKNAISKQLDEYDVRLRTMLAFLAKKEERYYMEFSRMESALAQLQNQAGSLASMLGG